MNKLLIEIGTEEIPAGYIVPALNAFAEKLLKAMDVARIDHGEAKTYGTPRRLSVIVENVADKQKSVSTELMGPPERVGFDENGKPTVPAQKFAEKAGVPLSKIVIQETPKGRYLCAKKTERGISTGNVLKELIPGIILSLPFPKSMKWSDLQLNFARPIHSILALLGKKVISFSMESIKSGRFTRGHSFACPGKIKINSPDEYVEKLSNAKVIIDIAERRKIVEEKINDAAFAAGGKVLPDEELIDIVTNLVELPVPVAGKFEEKFLELPDEILITSMREHQKYFAVVDDKGNLMPCFVAVNNTPVRDLELVANGHARVLRARLEDAMFFFKTDKKATLDEWMEKLKKVLFQAKLGSVYEKALRIQALSEWLSENTGLDAEAKKQVSRAAYLCKADLVSQTVGEFPKLQGVMGNVYATIANENKTVGTAIEEHYRPTYSGGILPETMAGAIVSIADKMDSICGCFSAGLIPTGAADPYALRRQSIGIVQIINDKGMAFSFNELISKSTGKFCKNEMDIQEISEKVYDFIKSRINFILSEEGFSKDVIAAVTDISIDHIPNIRHRVKALESLKTMPDFEPLAIAFKRVVNIIKKANPDEGKTVEASLFVEKCESVLFEAFNNVEQRVIGNLEEANFDQALKDIASLRPPVDEFFDGVMVMAEDGKLRNNRLGLLRKIANLFAGFADFSKIST
ncbi:MAG: glycine--tRNA ligase subunit beta [Desulfobacterales bacterium]|nr:glycine--tRNA ligase subunit beta [Desulfobacterales bacterium]